MGRRKLLPEERKPRPFCFGVFKKGDKVLLAKVEMKNRFPTMIVEDVKKFYKKMEHKDGFALFYDRFCSGEIEYRRIRGFETVGQEVEAISWV